jgi:hypothetical protein
MSRAIRLATVLAVLTLVLGLRVAPAAATGNPNPGIIPNGARYENLSSQWWQWMWAQPADVNPLSDPDGTHCAQGQSGNIWFLAGNGGGSTTRTCTMPAGKQVFFPVMNADVDNVWDPPTSYTVDELRQMATAAMDDPVSLEATIDGVAIQDLASYRVQSGPFAYTLPDGNLYQSWGLDVPAGTYSPAIADGYWLLHTPFPPGEHVVHFSGESSFGFALDVTYYLTVEP